MNHRKLAMAAMRGEPVDHIPFIARMDLWHSYHSSRATLPPCYANASLWDLQRDLGVGILGFGTHRISFYRLQYQGVEVVHREERGALVTEYRTPHGDLRAVDTMTDELSDAASTPARVEYPFKTAADYDALMSLISGMRPVEDFENYGAYVDSIGDDGVALPFTSHLPAHQLMLKYMGYERFYYEMSDRPNMLQRLIDVLGEQFDGILDLAARSPADAIEVGGNYDEDMTPPPIFERFFAPIYWQARERLSAAGKVMVVHGDGEMRHLLPALLDCGVEVVEALTPRPMTSIDMREVRRLWSGCVAVWGGVPSVVLTSTFSDDEFERSLDELFEAVAPGDRFILGFGDNVPTDASFERIERLVEYWREHGTCPLRG